MSENIQKSKGVRSPNSPGITLEDALVCVEKLYKGITKGAVKAEAAVIAMEYTGLNGKSLTVLAALNQYGLIHRPTGDVQITPLGLKVIFGTPEQKAEALALAALNPKVFKEIYEKWPTASEGVIASQLAQENFTKDAADRAASVFKSNFMFAKLDGARHDEDAIQENAAETDTTQAQPQGKANATPPAEKPKSPPAAPASQKITYSQDTMLATFKMPTGLSDVELIFTGTKLEAEAFDALAAYIPLFKKQYERKLQAEKEWMDRQEKNLKELLPE